MAITIVLERQRVPRWYPRRLARGRSPARKMALNLLDLDLASSIARLLNSGESMQETADIVGVSLRSLRIWARIGDHQNEFSRTRAKLSQTQARLATKEA